jgi:ParB family chromosome partitioning protein
VIKGGSDEQVLELRKRLRTAITSEAQIDVLRSFAAGNGSGAKAKAQLTPKQKFEFHLGKTKVTARQGECRIVSGVDYAAVPKGQLERAVKAFEEAFKDGGNPWVTLV